MKNIIIFLLLIFVSNAYSSNDSAFFWKVKSSNNKNSAATIFLLGSIHVADKSFYPLRKSITSAYEQSNNLVVELDVTKLDQQELKSFLDKKGKYQGDKGIEDYVSSETLASLQRQLTKLNVPMSVVRHSKPGTLVMTLTMIQILQMGFSPEFGIDLHFLRQDKTKNIIELETLASQLGLLLEISEGELLLKEALNSMDDANILIHQLISAWKKGDDVAMEKILFTDALTEYPEFSVIYEKLFFERNIKMTQKIKQFFKTGDNYFVIVGAGHLIGDKGIVELLRDDGYEIERL